MKKEREVREKNTGMEYFEERKAENPSYYYKESTEK